MPADTKPYRRFRARRRGSDVGQDMAQLQELVARKEASGNPAPPKPQRPAAPRRPAPPPRQAHGTGPAEQRRRWSLRGARKRTWVLRGAVFLLVAFVGWAGIGLFVLSRGVGEANDRITTGARRALSPSSGMLGEAQNTLIVGSDARRGRSGQGLADTIMVMRTDPDAGRVKYLSIPRDFQVQLPRFGTEKINAALPLLGQAGMIRAVRNLTGLPIHHIIVIGFRGLPELVDDLGGVTVNNPTALVDCPYPGGTTVSFPKGRISLNGDEALRFARVRQCDNDFARAARQQALVAALKGAVLSPSHLPAAPWRGAAVARTMSTDLGTFDMVKMGWLQARLEQKPGDRIVLAGDTATIGAVSYVIGRPDENERQIARFVSSQ